MRTWNVMRPLFAAMVGLLTTSAADGAIVRFHERVTVELPVVRLGDVAEIFDADAQRVRRLENLVLSPAPPAGRERPFTFGEIRSRCAAMGMNLAEIEFRGAALIRVTSAGTKVEPPKPKRRERTTPAPREQIQTASHSDRRHVEEELTKLVLDSLTISETERAATKVTIQIETTDADRLHEVPVENWQLLSPPGQAVGQGAFVVSATGEDQKPFAVTFRATIEQPAQHVVLRHAIPHGHILREADLELAWVDGQVSAADALTIEQAVGCEAVRGMAAGRPLTLRDVRPVPLVRTNDLVTVIARQGGLSVSRVFKARGNAALGESVVLISLEDREQISAIVTGYHEAEVVGSDGGESDRGENRAAANVTIEPAGDAADGR